jgi:diguanylate cyclase (GGDEF)-like protein
LRRLGTEADGLIEKLSTLRSNLGQIREHFRTSGASGDLEIGALQLVQTALHAERVAEAATARLSELAWLSHRDPLTNLPNRALMLDRLENAIALARRQGSQFAVLFLDLDNFKRINDTLGHAIGDEALKLVARRLRSTLRESDTVSRYGGEEFVVLLPNISCATDAEVIAQSLQNALASPSRAGPYRLELSASIGVSTYPEDGEDAQSLVGRADAAMYRAKARGPGNVEFFGERQRALSEQPGQPPEAPNRRSLP